MSKQVLFVCAGKEFPQGAFNFLKGIHDHETMEAIGLFFNPIDIDALTAATQLPVQAPYDRIRQREHEVMIANKALFTEQCQKYHIRHRILSHDDQWDKATLIAESRFADILLLSGELFYADINLHQPNTYLQEALCSAECPVLVIPEGYRRCDRVYMAYDGSKESMHAIKQFCHLFPQLTDLPTEMLYAQDEASEKIPDLNRLRRYTCGYFDAMGFSKLHFKASHYFATWIGEHKDILLVAGSYGRSSFSYMARHSFVQQVIQEHKIPVFIAHT